MLVDGTLIELNALGTRIGQCRVELQLSDGTEAMVEGTGVEFTSGQVGAPFEQWRGPIWPQSS